MKKFLFETSATMKEHDSKNWWIDKDIIRNLKIDADDVNSAIVKYSEIVKNRHYISISPTAIKRASPMYIDGEDDTAMQVGVVLTGKTSFDNDEGKDVTKYIDLWVNILEIKIPVFN